MIIIQKKNKSFFETVCEKNKKFQAFT